MKSDLEKIISGKSGSLRFRLFLVIFSGIYVSIFIYLFEPFGISQKTNPDKLYITLGYGAIALIVPAIVFIIFEILDRLILYINLILKLVAIAILIIAGLSVAFHYYNQYLGMDDVFGTGFQGLLLDVLVIAVLPSLVMVILAERKAASWYLKNAAIMSQEITNIPVENKSIKVELTSDNKRNNVIVNLEDLLCIQGSDNYSTVYYNHNNKPVKEMLRVTMKNLCEQLEGYEEVMRCHKSYIVNLMKVEKVSGNAQGYKLHIEGLDFTVPVSRNFPKEALEKTKKLKS